MKWEAVSYVLLLVWGFVPRRALARTIRHQAESASLFNCTMKTADNNDPGCEDVQIVVLEPNTYLSRGEFIASSSGAFSLGLSGEGYLELHNEAGSPIWSSLRNEVQITPAHGCYLQGDGNLVLRDDDRKPVFNTSTGGKPGARLVLSDSGVVSLIMGERVLWSRSGASLSPATGTGQGPSPSDALSPNEYLEQNEFMSSPSGRYTVGLTSDGDLVLVDGTQSTRIWKADISRGHRVFMQTDGNLVVRDEQRRPLFSTATGGIDGALLVVSDNGYFAIVLGNREMWKSDYAVSPPVPAPLPSPVLATVPMPVTSPQSYNEEVVLQSGDSLQLNEFVSSPNEVYRVGLNGRGDLVLLSRSLDVVWNANIQGGSRVFMQTDGNLIVRDENFKTLWSSRTSGNLGARLIVDDGGEISIVHGSTALWLAGNPRGTYQTPPSSQDLQFPLRGMFYYPWFPETWTVNGKYARFEPDLGFYNSGNPVVAEEHIDAMEYAWVDVAIASWWGPDTNLDRARLTLLLDETAALNSTIKWTVYHEDERHADPAPQLIREDLDYLKKWFVWHPTWAHIDARPVIFVYNEAGCDVPERWMAASNGEWYVVLKLFKGFRDCPIQPDSWHQYGPADPVIHIDQYSYSVSPGFWRADIDFPLLNRVSETDFCQNTAAMVASDEPWQLITTFNEAGEGTMVEASPAWRSSTKYGLYLDCLHKYH